ncbi:MAG: anhydro-N-acetylmuramic acid kinase [Woeseiaceae bacterium]|nr:anhydro-N-acetylmuramic acid kinase [Woeseiaceae bacterium]
MPDAYIGLISGTSMDGIDAVLVEFGQRSLSIRSTLAFDYPAGLRERLQQATRSPSTFTIDEFGELDRWVGECFRDAALAVIEEAGASASDVRAIGSHGQTVRHRPDAEHRFTLQIGDPSVIATGTGIDTVADFRRADLALGGEGAPLVPAFHDWLFRAEDRSRAILNIGGVANLTILPAGDGPVTGFDTGPGNSLMDTWAERHLGKPFDHGGEWSMSGQVDSALLDAMLDDEYFAVTPPKSTGFEYFNADWLERFDIGSMTPANVQASLCELTAASIASALDQWAPDVAAVFVCGGGAHNSSLLERLGRRLPDSEVGTTASIGLDPDWVEACAFAWLTMRRLENAPGSVATVTGASRDAILGAIHAGGRA